MKKAIILTMCLAIASTANAQVFFHRIDVNMGNIYSFVASNLISAGLNQLTKDRLVDTSFGYTIYSHHSNSDDINIKDYNRTGLTIKDLFADSTFGAKLGYQSSNPGVFNWAIYGSCHYRINQFKLLYDDSQFRQNIQRLQLGGGLLFSFGDIEHDTRFVIEAGLRYNIPIFYDGSIGESASSAINTGLTSHYSLRFGGFGFLKGVGIFAEVPHYNSVKGQTVHTGLSLKPYTFGITYTIMP